MKTTYIKNDTNVKTGRLFGYMELRAECEKQKWELTIEYLEALFVVGTRRFFGVELNELGDLLCDDQQPEFFKEYLAAEL